MEEIKISKEKLEAAYKEASEETKQVLEGLFAGLKKPTLDDYTSIKTYEDACEALGIIPIASTHEDEENDIMHVDNGGLGGTATMPLHIVALMKLETISRALWGRNWQPEPDAEGKDDYWYPWFALWTEDEIKDLNADQRGALLSAIANNGANAGFGSLSTYRRSSNANASVGFRLCQETEEKARYFGTQFVELWSEYLRFNFTTGERIKTKGSPE